MYKMASKLLIVTLVLLLFAHNSCAKENQPVAGVHRDVVVTESGTVRGRLAKQGDYFAFLGIPYAAAPKGLLRFKAPQPPQSWGETFEADREVICPQLGVGEEDCLIVNVFIPRKKANETLPVLLYVHGGFFRYGSGPTDGVAPIVEHGVIFVSINYRLGPIGFLCLGTDEATGNAGLQDQLAALKWVKKNIENFGGDSNNITVYGTGSGGACVELLILSKSSAGLFQKAVIESGSSGAVWAIDNQPLCTAKNFAKAFTVSELEHPNTLLELYQNVPVNVLTTVNERFANSFTDGRVGFAPCVQRPLAGAQAIVCKPPSEIIRKGRFSNIPLMFVFASLEGLFLKTKEYFTLNYAKRMEANFAEFLPYDLNFDSEMKRIEKAAEVRRFYFGNKTIENNQMEYLYYFGDSLVLRALIDDAESHARRGNVYLLEFAYRGKMGDHDEFFKNIDFAGHGDFKSYVILNKTIQTESDKFAIDSATTFLCNFIIHGKPTSDLSDGLSVNWPKIHAPDLPYLRIGRDLQVLKAPYSKRIHFWRQLYYDFGRRRLNYETNPC